MENKDIILFILIIIVFYLLFCEYKHREQFTSTQVDNRIPIKDMEDVIKNLFKDEIESRDANKHHQSNILITESIKNLGLIAKKINDNKLTKIPNSVEVNGLIINGKDNSKYTLNVIDGNLYMAKLDYNDNLDNTGKVILNGDSEIAGNNIVGGTIEGDNGNLDIKGSVNVIGGNINLHNKYDIDGNILKNDDGDELRAGFINIDGNIEMQLQKKIKWVRKVNINYKIKNQDDNKEVVFIEQLQTYIPPIKTQNTDTPSTTSSTTSSTAVTTTSISINNSTKEDLEPIVIEFVNNDNSRQLKQEDLDNFSNSEGLATINIKLRYQYKNQKYYFNYYGSDIMGNGLSYDYRDIFFNKTDSGDTGLGDTHTLIKIPGKEEFMLMRKSGDIIYLMCVSTKTTNDKLKLKKQFKKVVYKRVKKLEGKNLQEITIAEINEIITEFDVALINFENIKFNKFLMTFNVNNKKYLLTQTSTIKDTIMNSYKFVDTNCDIKTDGSNNLEINWSGKPVYMNNIYCKGNIETEGILNFKKHKYAPKWLKSIINSRGSLHRSIVSENKYEEYLIKDPYMGVITVD